ncbi:unnamed protein product [marine sediment metagenome]|uniref:DUF1015 domain-containing protein n=1 Tax=marine sediment metagenome TaxID=412755 RepID=X0UKU3_9ZZZZ
MVHRLWKVNDAAWIGKVRNAMADKYVVIADGHHRYETALAYHERTGAAGEYAMMTFVPMEDPGLVILPIHRVVQDNAKDKERSGWKRVKDGLQENFDLERCRQFHMDRIVAELFARGKEAVTFWVKRRSSESYWMTLKEGAGLRGKGKERHSDKWSALGVSILQSLVLKKIFKLTPESIQKGERIRCVKDPKEALEALECLSDFDYLFLLNPLQIDNVNDVVSQGERMPQKSTNFHPKVYSGFVLQKL